MNCLKKTKKYVNVSKPIPFTEGDCKKAGLANEYASGNGNQPKRLSGKFVSVSEDGIQVKEVPSEIVYHHTKNAEGKEAGDGDLLYAFEAIRTCQTFSGTITGKAKYIKILAPLLRGVMRFGKSKSAQYGKCVLNGEPGLSEIPEKTYAKGSRILVYLQSDGVFLDDNGYTVECAGVREAIKSALGIVEKQDERVYTEIETKRLTGYYTKWNLKRQAIPAVRAGSAFEFVLDQDLKLRDQALYAGARKGEGFGRLAVIQNDQTNCSVPIKKAKSPSVAPDKTRSLCGEILFSELKNDLMFEAGEKTLGMTNPAALGRLTLMLTESVRAYPEMSQAEKRFENYLSSIASIKTKNLQEKADRIVEEYIGTDLDHLQYWESHKDADLWKKSKDYVEDLDARLKDLWNDYLMAMFVCEKYALKKKG